MIKSPSDTTLYRPALQRKDSEKVVITGKGVVCDLLAVENEMYSHFAGGEPVTQEVSNDMSQKISTFVESIQKEQQQPVASTRDGRNDANQEFFEAEKRVDQSVIEAENFKAKITAPTGELINFNTQPMIINRGVPGRSDEEFFQLMCHVDTLLRQKREDGEFIDLEKLLPKDRRSSMQSEEECLEWVYKDGGTYLAPVSSKENRITGIKKWDQAFRIYFIIYCGAHPERSKEIWQYVDLIHISAASFVWENVASYDYTFDN